MGQAEPFADNWAYLRTELSWLDRVLATAIARQHKDTREINRVAQSRADRVTSHWWKGLIHVEGAIASDSPADMPRRGGGINYQQQMETRILASQQRGLVLGLPSLCQLLKLTTFEKNLVLIALAAEVSRRYGRIYDFLQEVEQPRATGLPTIDLILRLLCRSDTEWRTARLSFTSTSKLVQHNLVSLPTAGSESFLAHPVKLSDPLVEYLLADAPQLSTLKRLLQTSIAASDIERPPLPQWTSEQTIDFSQSVASDEGEDLWAKLVLPSPLLADLRHLCDRVQYAKQVDGAWGFNKLSPSSVGSVTLLTGASGTGKTFAARAIAQTLKVPLLCLDLALLNPDDFVGQIEQLIAQSPTVLLLKSASVWFGRSAIVPPELQQLLHHRQHNLTITLLSAGDSAIKAMWRKSFQTLHFPLPNAESRLELWQHAFPPDAPLATDIDWQEWANLPLSGGEIGAIAREAALYAAAAAVNINSKHLLQAYTGRPSSNSNRKKPPKNLLQKGFPTN